MARRRGVPPPSEPALWPPSGSLSVLVLRPGKIGVWVFVSSNSENISCVAFLKHKNSRKQGTGVLVFVSSNSENISCVAFLKHKNSRKQGTGTVASCQ
jgi:hypothetical protein